MKHYPGYFVSPRSCRDALRRLPKDLLCSITVIYKTSSRPTTYPCCLGHTWVSVGAGLDLKLLCLPKELPRRTTSPAQGPSV